MSASPNLDGAGVNAPAPLIRATQPHVIEGAMGDPSEPDATADTEEDTSVRLSDRLMTELSAHRTLALLEALANDPDTAFLAVMGLPTRRQASDVTYFVLPPLA